MMDALEYRQSSRIPCGSNSRFRKLDTGDGSRWNWLSARQVRCGGGSMGSAQRASLGFASAPEQQKHVKNQLVQPEDAWVCLNVY